MPTAQELLQAQATALANAGATREQIDDFLRRVQSSALVDRDLGSLSLAANSGQIGAEEFIAKFEATHAQPLLDETRKQKWAESFSGPAQLAAGAAGGVMEPLAGAAHLVGIETPELDAKIEAYRYLGNSSRAAWWTTGVGALAPNLLLGGVVGAVGRGISVGVGASRTAARLIGAATAFGAGYTFTNEDKGMRLFAASLWGLGGAFDIPRPKRVGVAPLTAEEQAISAEWQAAKSPPEPTGVVPDPNGLGPEAPLRTPGPRGGVMQPGMGTDASAIPRSRALVTLPSVHFPQSQNLIPPGLTRLRTPAEYLWEAVESRHSVQSYEQHIGSVIAQTAHERFPVDSLEYAALAERTTLAIEKLHVAKMGNDLDSYVDGAGELWGILFENGPRSASTSAEVVGASGIAAVGDAISDAQRVIVENMPRFAFNPSSDLALDLVNLQIVAKAVQGMRNPDPTVLRYLKNLTSSVNRSLGVLHELPASAGVGGTPPMKFALSADEILDQVQLSSGPQLMRQVAVLSRKYRATINKGTTLKSYPELSAASALLKHAVETKDNAGMLYAWGELEKIIDLPGAEDVPIELADDMARAISSYINLGLDAAQANDSSTMIATSDMINEGRLVLWRLYTLGTNLAVKDAKLWMRRAGAGRSVPQLQGNLGAINTGINAGVEREAMQVIKQLEGFVSGLNSLQSSDIKQVLDPLLKNPEMRSHPIGKRVIEMLQQIKVAPEGKL